MGLIDGIFSSTIGKAVAQIAGVVERFTGSKAMDAESADKKRQMNREILEIVQARDSEVEQTLRTEMAAKERVLVAELQQGDSFTKRARPTVVYVGLGAFVFNYVIVPNVSAILGTPLEPIAFPAEFWYGWSGIVGTWSIGRTFEKRGARNNVISAVTGSRLLD